MLNSKFFEEQLVFREIDVISGSPLLPWKLSRKNSNGEIAGPIERNWNSHLDCKMFKLLIFYFWNICLPCLSIKLPKNVTNLCMCQIDETNQAINTLLKICIIIVAGLRRSTTHSEKWTTRHESNDGSMLKFTLALLDELATTIQLNCQCRPEKANL